MALNTQIFDRLRNSTSITAYTSTRVYPVMMPQGVAAFPALLYTRVSADGIYSLSGYSGKQRVRYSVDSIAKSHDEARALADAAHTVLAASTEFACIRLTEGESYDADYELHLVSQTYSIIGGT